LHWSYLSFAVTEKARLDAVRRYDILDTASDWAFDRITVIAARLLKVPIAIISIVDHDRIWFKWRHGIDMGQTDREPGLCASCVLQDNAWIINDAKNDVRSRTNPLVAGQLGIQFYLGIPLRTHDGFNVGTLCVLDFVSRAPSENDVDLLKDLAVVVMEELELRLAARIAQGDYHAELARRELREDHIKGLLRELAHRSKNLLSVIQAIARQTAGDAEQRYASGLSARVEGLGCTHDLLAEQEWRGAKLAHLAARHVSLFREANSRVELDGPNVILAPPAAQHVGLALHELSANAVQYGSLSVSTGKVAFRWQIDNPDKLLQLTWVERGGPPARVPTQRKFGCLVLERLVPEGLGGWAALSFDAGGVEWTCEMPVARIVAW
jgi:two-component sensor histidine kinase